MTATSATSSRNEDDKHIWLLTNEKPLPLKPYEARLVRYGVPLSFFQKNGTRVKSWWPWSLRPFFLCFLVCVSLGFIVSIELLRQKSDRHNGLAFYQSSDDIPVAVSVAYTYSPTILATFFGILWSIIDLDAKRMEPFTQISDTAHHAFPLRLLFLDYAYIAAWKVPYRALKNGHWIIAITSVTSMLTIILLAPMQSALFGLSASTLTKNVSLEMVTGLPSLNVQRLLFTGESNNQAYSIANNLSVLPPFTTEEYAVAPVRSLDGQESVNRTLTFQTQVYWSELQCLDMEDFNTSIISTSAGGSVDYYSFEDVNFTVPEEASIISPCSIRSILTFDGIPTNLSKYATWDVKDPNEGWFGSRNCTSFNFLATSITVQPEYTFTNDTRVSHLMKGISFLCKPSYYSTIGEVTAMPNGSIASVKVLDIHQPELLDRSSLDIDSLEISISGMNNDDESLPPISMSPMYTFVEMNVITMRSLIRQSYREDQVLDRQVLRQTITSTYRRIAALAISRVLRNVELPNLSNNSALHLIQAVSEETSIAITTNTYFAIASEVVLGFAMLAALVNLFSFLTRESIIRNDPDSLAAMFSLTVAYFRNIRVLQHLSSTAGTESTRALKHSASYFTCKSTGSSVDRAFSIEPVATKLDILSRKPIQKYQRPFHLTKIGHFIPHGLFIFTSIGCVILLTTAYQGNFTYLAETNSLASQALWQFSPTLAATIIGMTWTIIHRDISIIEPWFYLKDQVPASYSLSVNYASRIPLIVMFKAARKRNYFLSFVSFVCLSANILNIAMGGLFFQSFSTITTTIPVSSTYGQSLLPGEELGNSDRWNTGNVFDLVRANVTDNSTLPPWCSKETYFLPVDYERQDLTTASLSVQGPITEYNVTTFGIGASLECRSAGTRPENYWYAFGFNRTGNGNDLSDFVSRVYPGPVPAQSSQGTALAWEDCWVTLTGLTSNLSAATFIMEFRGRGQENCGSYIVVLENIIPAQPDKVLHGVICWPRPHFYHANITLDSSMRVTGHHLEPISNETVSPFRNIEEHLEHFTGVLKSTSQSFNVNGNDIRDLYNSYDWVGLLLARIQHLNHPDGRQSTAILAEAVSLAYAQMFVSFWALYSPQFLVRANNTDLTIGSVSYEVAHMTPSIPAFAITFFLLVLYITTAVLVRVKRGAIVIPRIPNSIGTIWPWIIHSRILSDYKDTAHLSSKLRDDYLNSLEKKYRFGWFKDEEGILRLGLEDSRYIERAWVASK